MTDVVAFDEAKAGAIAEKLMGDFNGAAVTIMTSIGHKTGLFDVMADGEAVTSAQLAEKSGLNERYVREWLGAMAAGQIVELDASNNTYRLPPEHAMFLTRASGPNNLAAIMQFAPLLSLVEDDVVDCFKNGGGVPYSKFPTFQKLMAESSAQVHDAALVDGILPMVPGLIDKLNAGIDVADIGCGSGHAINLMAKAFPNSRFTGFDFSEEGVGVGTAEAKALGLSNATFAQRDVSELNESGAFDFITAFDAIHDQAKPAQVLANIATALRSGGTFLMVDVKASSHVHENIDHPMGAFLYTVSTLHCMTVSLALDGEGLGTAWGHQLATQMLADAGFTDVKVEEVADDILNLYYIAQKA